MPGFPSDVFECPDTMAAITDLRIFPSMDVLKTPGWEKSNEKGESRLPETIANLEVSNLLADNQSNTN